MLAGKQAKEEQSYSKASYSSGTMGRGVLAQAEAQLPLGASPQAPLLQWDPTAQPELQMFPDSAGSQPGQEHGREATQSFPESRRPLATQDSQHRVGGLQAHRLDIQGASQELPRHESRGASSFPFWELICSRWKEAVGLRSQKEGGEVLYHQDWARVLIITWETLDGCVWAVISNPVGPTASSQQTLVTTRTPPLLL